MHFRVADDSTIAGPLIFFRNVSTPIRFVTLVRYFEKFRTWVADPDA